MSNTTDKAITAYLKIEAVKWRVQMLDMAHGDGGLPTWAALMDAHQALWDSLSNEQREQVHALLDAAEAARGG